jgi:methylthioribulose-1-phosphate dehydratase
VLNCKLNNHQNQQLDKLCESVQSFGASGWTPANSGNFSLRLELNLIAISVSGCDKQNLSVADLMLVDGQGRPLDSKQRPSAECLLHAQLYQRYADVHCVLHTHSMNQTVASLRFHAASGVELHNYELLKALEGYHSHLQRLQIPVLANDQQIPALVNAIAPRLAADSRAYLIDGHGMYGWGRDVASARRHVEAIEFMLSCELARSQ